MRIWRIATLVFLRTMTATETILGRVGFGEKPIIISAKLG
jgi:hypothetical protein